MVLVMLASSLLNNSKKKDSRSSAHERLRPAQQKNERQEKDVSRARCESNGIGECNAQQAKKYQGKHQENKRIGNWPEQVKIMTDRLGPKK